ncbi:2-hydroxyacid dehydrogenase [Alkalicoccus halolimnae]|uniref:D-glycerate dehydrogenase n=1 Tax=Alkalicoccus halolimnae TaxID=1667239 RepID=A0A5C7FEQ3_9BACI|nr:D-glycerate dehydrogenase [Alkalicoccus halolimnae]TXF84268.1 D-glycerate dehydrogenase [Alkalicoccus halolimnae]
MSKPFVYVTRQLPDDVLKPLREQAEVECWPYTDEPVPRETLLEKAAEAEGLLTMLTDQVDEELMERAPRLKVAANLAVGFDNIDTKEASKRGIIICNTPDVLTEATADLGFALLMASARRIPEAAEYIKNDEWHQWSPFLLAGSDVHGKTLGIIGMGRIGAAIAKRSKGFDMNILYHNRSRADEAERDLGAVYASKEELLRHADFVCIVAPLTDETKGMIDKKAFQYMKSSAFLINVSRGPVVNEEDLIDALERKEIAGAGLDVYEQEPIGANHPLLQFPQVTALPHIGSATTATRKKMVSLAAENIALVLQGKEAATPVKQ